MGLGTLSSLRTKTKVHALATYTHLFFLIQLSSFVLAWADLA